MLRRKLFIVFGSLVLLLLATAVGAVWVLQHILSDLHHIDSEALVVVEESNELVTDISLIEIELYGLELSRQRHLNALMDLVESMEAHAVNVGRSYVTQLSENRTVLDRIRARLSVFREQVAIIGTTQDTAWASRHRREAMRLAVDLRQDILALSASVRSHAEDEQHTLTARFRWLVLGLTVIFLLMLNVSIIVLLRMAGMILRPVDKLIAATRELGHERFDYRVELDQKDEFDELAQAYNNLAGQLQANERRKLEMLGQVALTLNHELNNAAAIIELQLQLLSRQAPGNLQLEKCARQIHDSLERMTRTVELLKRVRRIVLTDYVSGVKMLDLERSVQERPESPDPHELVPGR